MKVTDYNEVANCAADKIDELCPDLVDSLGRDAAIFCVLAIYQTNDLCRGYGQDFTIPPSREGVSDYDKVSVISFENGTSVIVNSESSRYQDRFQMCGYEDLNEDITQICICIQAAFDRIRSRS